MEYEQEEQQEGGLMQRVKESPRTVSALIIILIVAAAIYAFSGDDTSQQTAQIGDDSAIIVDQEAVQETVSDEAMEDEDAMMEEGQTGGETEVVQPVGATPAPVTQEEITAQREALPEATTTEEGYVEVAQAGNGLTHLARSATTRYLSERSAPYSVTNEHRIYIEDYIKDHMEQQPLSIGDSRTVSFSLIEEAVAAAGQLNDSQLRNLTQYTYVLN